MPTTSEKKTVQIGVKIPESLNEELERIAENELRPLGQVVRMLMIRGLSQYRIDGKLHEDAPARGKVLATISPGRQTREEIRRQVIGDDIDDLGTVDYMDSVTRTAERVRLSLLKSDVSTDDAEGFQRAYREATEIAGERIAKKRKAKI